MLVVAPSAVVGGAVHDATGRPVPGARIALRRAVGAHRAEVTQRTLSDRNGRYRLCGVPAGRFVVEWLGFSTAPALTQSTTVFAVEAGARVERNLVER